MLSALQVTLVSGLMATVLASPWDLEKRGCGNNCARAVIASAYPLRPTAVDCSAYLHTTVTPPVSTVTETVTGFVTEDFTTTDATVTLTQTDFETATAVETVTTITTKPYAVAGRGLVARADPTIPAYASACKDSAAYVEACGCIGVSSSTTYAPTPTTTVTVPATVTETNTIEATATDLATITETVPTTQTTVEVVTVTAGPPTCVVPFPNSCKSGGNLVACGIALALQWDSISDDIEAAAKVCLKPFPVTSWANRVTCLRAAFQCPAGAP